MNPTINKNTITFSRRETAYTSGLLFDRKKNNLYNETQLY